METERQFATGRACKRRNPAATVWPPPRLPFGLRAGRPRDVAGEGARATTAAVPGCACAQADPHIGFEFLPPGGYSPAFAET
jgi:hypothetical protein